MRSVEISSHRMIDVKEVARILSVCARTVRRLASRGILPQPIRFGRNVRWHLEEIEGWIAGRATMLQAQARKHDKT